MTDKLYCKKCGRSMGESTVEHDVAHCPYNDPDCYCCENCGDHYTCDLSGGSYPTGGEEE